jgi:hypothetical protein
MTRGQTPAVAKPAISNGKCLLASIYNKLNRCKKNGCTDMSRGQTPGWTRVSKATASTCGVWGNMSTGRTRSRV